MAAPEASFQAVRRDLLSGPFRASHFDTSKSAIAKWQEDGYEEDAVVAFLTWGYSMMASQNYAVDLRIQSSVQYMIGQGFHRLSLVKGYIRSGWSPKSLRVTSQWSHGYCRPESGHVSV
eukprot:361758-Chlamydomonas_euryale.AAC.10